MRLLPGRPDHGCHRAPEEKAQAHGRRHRCGDDQHLPLRHLQPHSCSDPSGRRQHQRRVHQRQQSLRRRVMTTATAAARKNVSRRNFLISSTAAGGGLALGFHVPGLSDALAQLGTEGNEVGAWVFIKPNDDVIIRVARSEMGQGTLTGLAQQVAEELECDWKKVKAEYVTPGENLARDRAWGDMSTGGSRGIRGSHEYVRKGGAAAREMLIQAAANVWKVPAGECKAEASVITHTPSGRKTTYGKVASAAAKPEGP